MTRLQWILLALIISEATAVVLGWYRDDRQQQLPVTRLNVLDPASMKEIRQREAAHRPENRTDWLDLAAIYRTFGLLPEALYCYEQAQQLGSLRPEHHFSWGICLSRFGKMEAAQEHLNRVIVNHHEWEADAWLQIGFNYLREENPEKAEFALRKAIQRPIAKFTLARLLARTDRPDEALVLLNELIERYPNGLRVHQLKSWVHDLNGETEQAEYHRERVLRAVGRLPLHDRSRREDDRWFQRIGNGRLYFDSIMAEQRGDLQQATELAALGLEAAWQEDRALRMVYLLLARDDLEQALLQLEKFIARVGESAESLTFLGEVLKESGKTTEAIQVWQRASGYRAGRFADTNMRIHEKLMMVYQETGETKKASRQQGLMRLEKARIMWNNDEVRNSLVDFDAAVKLIPDAEIAWFYLAETRRLLGDGSGARVAYQRCLQLRPQHGRAIRALARLEQ